MSLLLKVIWERRYHVVIARHQSEGDLSCSPRRGHESGGVLACSLSRGHESGGVLACSPRRGHKEPAVTLSSCACHVTQLTQGHS